jgi:hypothetical protein
VSPRYCSTNHATETRRPPRATSTRQAERRQARLSCADPINRHATGDAGWIVPLSGAASRPNRPPPRPEESATVTSALDARSHLYMQPF